MRDVRQGKNIEKRYYLAEITHWGKGQPYPTCVITQSLGEIGQLETEKLRILQALDHEGFPSLMKREEIDSQEEIDTVLKEISDAIQQRSPDSVVKIRNIPYQNLTEASIIAVSKDANSPAKFAMQVNQIDN